VDVGLTETQELLKRSAREALADICPPALVRASEVDPNATRELYAQMGELGWLGLPFPESVGGSGEDTLTLCVLAEELGFAAATTPFLASVAQAGQVIANAGSDEQKNDLLARISRGDLVASLVVAEPGPRFSPDILGATAAFDGDTVALKGVKAFVPCAGQAETFVVAARPAGDSAGDVPCRVTLVLVERDDPGVTVKNQKSIGGEPLGELHLENVRVPSSRLLGSPGQGREALEHALSRAVLADVAYTLGAAEKAMDMAIEYTNNRVAFGRPIGSFQAIQHKAADMAVDLDSARLLLYKAAHLLDEGVGSDIDVAMAKVWAGEAGRRIIAHSHQMHGAIGFTAEYDLNLYTRRMKAHEFVFGRPDEHVATVARGIGLAV
jgi:alkylation response protein AidB-like acyl-CoA dehydrogenase